MKEEIWRVCGGNLSIWKGSLVLSKPFYKKPFQKEGLFLIKTMNAYKVTIIKIRRLKQHENINETHLAKLKADIAKCGVLKSPIIVDLKTYTVLDGHHRLNSLKQLGVSRVPCILVDYFHDEKIRVTSRRSNYEITKEKVVKTAKEGHLFPFKTTRHFVPYRIKNLNLPLTQLI